MDNIFVIAGAIVLCIFLAAVSSCSANRDNKIAEMVKDGADPIKAACALRSSGNEPMCVLFAK